MTRKVRGEQSTDHAATDDQETPCSQTTDKKEPKVSKKAGKKGSVKLAEITMVAQVRGLSESELRSIDQTDIDDVKSVSILREIMRRKMDLDKEERKNGQVVKEVEESEETKAWMKVNKGLVDYFEPRLASLKLSTKEEVKEVRQELKEGLERTECTWQL